MSMEAPAKWTLHGWGRLAWSDIQRLLEGATCAWADYDGFHFGDCPDGAPPYSHLWAWKGKEVLYRVRIDGANGIVGGLTLSAMTEHAREPIESKLVEVVRHRGMPWTHDGRVGSVAAPALAAVKSITLVETLEPNPATFVSADVAV